MTVGDVLKKVNTDNAVIEIYNMDRAPYEFLVGRFLMAGNKFIKEFGETPYMEEKVLMYKCEFNGKYPCVQMVTNERKGLHGVTRAILGLDEDIRPFSFIVFLFLASLLYIFIKLDNEYFTTLFTLLCALPCAAIVRSTMEKRRRKVYSDGVSIKALLCIFASFCFSGFAILSFVAAWRYEWLFVTISLALLVCAIFLKECGRS